MDSQTVEGKLFHRGAEADLFLSRLGSWDTVVKRRTRRIYRNIDLDLRIRRERTAREALALHEARKGGVRTPVVLSLDMEKNSIVMTHVKGDIARDTLEKLSSRSGLTTLRELGRQIGLLHLNGMVHGDLTTSNIMIAREDLPFILDFGMSSHSSEREDMGVDLHLLKRSIVTSHVVDVESYSRAISRGYVETVGLGEARRTFRKAAEIARRGRYFALR